MAAYATDASAPHAPSTHTPAAPSPDSRWCLLHGTLARQIQKLGPRPTGAPFRTVIGPPVPAVEAWLLAGQAMRPSEAAWLQCGPAAAAASEEYKRQLKRERYGPVPRSDKPSVASHLIRGALATPGLLRTAFPGGFAPLEDEIRSW